MAKATSLNYKLALAIAIIRNKPDSMSAKQFTQLIQLNLRESYKSNKQIIEKLESCLLKAKQENILLKEKLLESLRSKSTTSSNLSNAFNSVESQISDVKINSFLELNVNQFKMRTQTNGNIAIKFANMQQYTKMKSNYELNIQFLMNLIKLKITGKNFQLDENVETIIETLKEFLKQIKYFFFLDYTQTEEGKIEETTHLNEKQNINTTESISNDSAINMSFSFDYTLFGETNLNSESIKKSSQNEINFYSFPHDCLIHALQIFLNIFQIEWLYYMRSNLMDILFDFIDDLIKFVFECSDLTQVCVV